MGGGGVLFTGPGRCGGDGGPLGCGSGGCLHPGPLRKLVSGLFLHVWGQGQLLGKRGPRVVNKCV